ncbi:bifunctional 4-hydroxy-2-oxoglutarate aldolase/2-dehydro-3-deoxy-phosphogluconate aldolase [Micromonospora sp. NBC_00898]|uniref:bifunctional 4-hydroxy-2-oxoglutarate aldolase/2-dehydro-3-deoxy-phosphogluconate aldolase n=1 Tax=Micromonospora sp. NBC_00898 TaxID=2975981 RepID=UPI00386B6EF9|nr:bifunctional 4-hydroxy-2-oxoglutarate aldolase/2-dehydro-3-deoxy-phosphogluconate aldolase [Micromonospora sp. NBC_00898]
MLSALETAAVIAVVRAPDRDSALHGVAALVAGGVTGIEITYSTPDAPGVIAELDRRFGDEICLGAGTVRSGEDARRAAAAGARFLVAPGTTPTVVAAMRDTGCAVLSGALTPSEVMLAVDLGVDVVKVFPASLGGPGYLKSLRAPFPDVPFMPTGGVNPENLHEWFAAGAVAVGAGSELCSAADLGRGDFAAVEAKARRFTAAHSALTTARPA